MAATARILDFLRDRRPEGPCLVVDLDVVADFPQQDAVNQLRDLGPTQRSVHGVCSRANLLPAWMVGLMPILGVQPPRVLCESLVTRDANTRGLT